MSTPANPTPSSYKESLSAGADRCVKCGMCSNVCPSYAFYQNEMESPRGRISLIQQLLQGNELGPQAQYHLDHCLHCYACERICPAQVPYQQLISHYLAETPHPKEESPLGQRALIQLGTRLRKHKLSNRLLTQLLPTKQQRLWQHLPKRQNIALHPAQAHESSLHGHPPLDQPLYGHPSLGPSPDQDEQRVYSGINMDSQAKTTKSWPEAQAILRHNQSAVAYPPLTLFAGCTSELLDQDSREACEHIFTKLGFSIQWTPDTLCCGALAKHGHQHQLFAQQTRALNAYCDQHPEPLLSFNSGCQRQLQESKLPVRSVYEWLSTQGPEQNLAFRQTTRRIALHQPCSSLGLADYQHSLSTLLDHCTHSWTAIPTSTGCCGAGGAHMINNPELSDASREPTLFWIQEYRPELILSSNIGCRLHIQAGLEALGLDIPVKHPIWLLNELVEG